MNTSDISEAIAAARNSGKQTSLDGAVVPASMEDALAIQRQVFARFGSRSVGWKVGATNKAAQDGFKIDGPFHGPIAESGVLEDGASIEKSPCIGACEPEYAFKMARDFPADGEAVTLDNAKDAVETVHIAVEVIGRCIANPDFANGFGVTMDFGGNAAFVLGKEVPDWRSQNLVDAVVESKVEGAVVATGNGTPVMGDPLNVIVWLANQLAAEGATLKAGEWVSTGTCTPAIPAEAGKTYTASFAVCGDVSVRFT